MQFNEALPLFPPVSAEGSLGDLQRHCSVFLYDFYTTWANKQLGRARQGEKKKV